MTLNSDYQQTHFQIKEPTKIDGEPTFETLQLLNNELKINSQCIPSTRGGGAHGHLVLVLTAVDYQLITLTPFIQPPDPGEFQIPLNPNITMEQISVMREQHNSLRHQFEKVSAVNAALR